MPECRERFDDLQLQPIEAGSGCKIVAGDENNEVGAMVGCTGS